MSMPTAAEVSAQTEEAIRERGVLEEEKRREELSPSGAYKLVVDQYSFGEKYWGYTRGQVFKQGSDEPLFTVYRNYGRFPFHFIEGHPNGHDYLVCGYHYQAQTVLELDTGKRKDSETGGPNWGFCWSKYEFLPEAQVMIVSGCFWACPYEYCVYDFSDPMQGWPHLSFIVNGESRSTSECDRKPEFLPDGTVKCFWLEEYEYDDDGEEVSDQPMRAYRIFKRQGNELVMTEEWTSPQEKRRLAEQKEEAERFRAFVDNYKQTSPIYAEFLKEPLAPTSISAGYSMSETFLFGRIVHNKRPIDIKWGLTKHPIEVAVYSDTSERTTKTFELSPEGMRQAFEHIRGVMQ